MTYIVRILIFLLISSVANGQEISSVSNTKRITGTGKINNSWDISFSIDFNKRLDYSSSGCLIKSYNQVAGRYKYSKQNNSISLLGEQIIYQEDVTITDSLVLYEFDENYNKTGRFSGILTINNYSGTWTNLNNNKSYPFYVNFTHDGFGSLKVSWNGKSFNLEDNHEYFQGKYKKIKEFDKGDTLIIIIETSKPCCDFYNCRGAGCGGANSYVNLYIITENSQSNFKEIIESSCQWTEIQERNHTKDKYSLIIEGSGGKFKIMIDYNNIQRGIIKKKI